MLSDSPISRQLKEHATRLKSIPMRDLFLEDPTRFERFSIEAAQILLDYSKNILDEKSFFSLIQFADSANLAQQIELLFTGGKVNTTEDRAALHTALREEPKDSSIHVEIQQVLTEMSQIVTELEQGQRLGFTKEAITDVVNLGIGGSDLGPAMATQALLPYHSGKIRCHFVSNFDAADITETFQKCRPGTTLFIVVSKSFATQETLCNANSAKNWLKQSGCEGKDLAKHFIGITAKPALARAWGISQILPIWDWVGGRFSLWSAVGLSIAFAIGMENFNLMRQGAHAMDTHFRGAPFSQNLPVILGLLTIWYVNFFNVRSHAILPYSHHLRSFPSYLQQLQMESGGKNRNHLGALVNYATCPVIWGAAGSNGQHAFHQLFFQGTERIPADFILPLNCHTSLKDHQTWLVSSCLSQSKALMLGKSIETAKADLLMNGYTSEKLARELPHRILEGNQPSNMLVIEQLTPSTLGALLALYEHKTFVQSVLWDVNCFDQWGVELGKQFTSEIFEELVSTDVVNEHDCSTRGLINYYKERRK